MINHKFVPYPLIFNFKDEILLVIYYLIFFTVLGVSVIRILLLKQWYL